MQIHNIDFHFHAGQERDEGVTLADHLANAVMTGRKVVNLTDHGELYLGGRRLPDNAPYSKGIEGLAEYRAELDKLKSQFPSLKLFFGPEFHPTIDLDTVPGELAKMSDMFLCALPPVEETFAANTAGRLARLDEIRRFRDRMDRPVLIVHPFHSCVKYQLVTHPIAPWITDIPIRDVGQYSLEELNKFFRFDISTLASACREMDLSVEINGGTHEMARLLNLPSVIGMLWSAFKFLAGEGVDIAPGSDQHEVSGPRGRLGVSVPADAFEAIGITAKDIRLLAKLDS